MECHFGSWFDNFFFGKGCDPIAFGSNSFFFLTFIQKQDLGELVS